MDAPPIYLQQGATRARAARTLNKQRRWAQEMAAYGWRVSEPDTGVKLTTRAAGERLVDLLRGLEKAAPLAPEVALSGAAFELGRMAAAGFFGFEEAYEETRKHGAEIPNFDAIFSRAFGDGYVLAGYHKA